MNMIQKWEAYGETHHPAWLDSLRVVLGLIILVKGVVFIVDNAALQQLIMENGIPFTSVALAHYVVFAHLVGGILIILGLKTRVAILFQIPILIGAIFFINIHRGILSGNGELLLSIVVLLLLIFFFFWGSGPLSADSYLRTHKDR